MKRSRKLNQQDLVTEYSEKRKKRKVGVREKILASGLENQVDSRVI